MIFLLIGFMAAGKTTAGAIAAARLSMPFHDLDQMIESTARMKICDIFAAQGEKGFRSLEHEAFRSLVTTAREHVIIAGGGGLVTNVANNELIQNCCVIFLDTPFAAIERRLAEDSGSRPLLAGMGAMQVRSFWEDRRQLYLKHAGFVIEDGDQISGLISKIIAGAKNERKQ